MLCQKQYKILSIIQIMLSFANVFTKEIAMKLYAACDLCEVYVNTCVRIKTLKFSKAKSNNVIMKKI